MLTRLLPDRKAVLSVSGYATLGPDSLMGDLELCLWDAVSGELLDRVQPSSGYEAPATIEIEEMHGGVRLRAHRGRWDGADRSSASPWVALGAEPRSDATLVENRYLLTAEGLLPLTMPQDEVSRDAASQILSDLDSKKGIFGHAVAVGDVLWVVRLVSACRWPNESPEAVLEHRVWRVSKGEPPSVFHEGPGPALVEALAGAQVLVQVGSQTYVVGPEVRSIDTAAALPRGLVVAAPLRSKVCDYI